MQIRLIMFILITTVLASFNVSIAQENTLQINTGEIPSNNSRAELPTNIIPSIKMPEGLSYPQIPLSGNISPRVIGGSNANEQYWDNIVALISYDSTVNSYYICGGTMLNARWVMTAAHCVTRSNGTLFPASDIYAYSEFYYPNYSDSKPGQVVYRHPSYNGTTVRNDIALIKLSANLGSVSKKTYLWDFDTSLYDTSDNKASVLGWGVTASGSLSDKLQQATTNIISNDECATTWYYIFDSSLCVQNPQSYPTSCNGDSGGPLFIKRNEDDAMQVGLVSWGVQGCDVPGYPSVYTRISYYINWIQSIVGASNLHYASDLIEITVEDDDFLLLISPIL